jgi:hypothetical protein
MMFENSQPDKIRGTGTFKILDTLKSLAFGRNPPVWDVILVNLDTLIRNNLGKGTRDDEVAKWTFEDIDNIIAAFHEYLEVLSVSSPYPHFVLYVPHYDALPNVHRRIPNKEQLRILKIQQDIEKAHFPRTMKPDVATQFGNMTCVTMHAGTNRTFPHQDIFSFVMNSIKEKMTLGKIKSTLGLLDLRIGMISRQAVDLHLARYVKKFTLIESFTGEIKSLESFGKKVFKVDTVPFNSATHLLFGDNILVEPMAKRKTKALLLERAESHRWISRSEASIIEDAVASGLVMRPMLTTVKF